MTITFSRSPVLYLSISLTAVACGGPGEAPYGSVGPAIKVAPELMVPDQPPGDVVVFFHTRGPLGLESATGVARSFDDALQRELVSTAREETLNNVFGDARARIRTYELIEAFAVEDVSADELAQLEADPNVDRVVPDIGHEAFMGPSLNLIGQPTVAAAGHLGAGVGIAILDTGVDYTHADLGSCTSVNSGGSCRVTFAQDFAPDDGALDANGHGTNVAAIALGVAPGANILSLDVFRANGQGFTSDIIAAIDWVVANRVTYGIQVMNLSLGGGAFTAACPNDAFAGPLLTAKNAGVLAAVASGNSGYTNQISSPACAPAAISVGAVYDGNYGGLSWSGCSDNTTAADRVTCFSNSASFLTVLAPGALITAGGHQMGGTSQAAPHVAGALAVLRQAFPNETVAQTQQRLVSSGVNIRDPKSNVTTPRIRLVEAIAASANPTPPPAPPPPPADVTPPTGTVVAAAGAAWTRTTAVALTLSATDASGVASMCVSATSNCTTFVPYSTRANVTLAGTGTTRTVYARFRDRAGNTSAAVTDTISFDNVVPRDGRVTATAGTRQVALSWSGYSDAASGIARYIVVSSTSGTPACTATPVYSGTGTSFTHTGRAGGTAITYRVCAEDRAGNRSAGVTARATPRR